MTIQLSSTVNSLELPRATHNNYQCSFPPILQFRANQKRSSVFSCKLCKWSCFWLDCAQHPHLKSLHSEHGILSRFHPKLPLLPCLPLKTVNHEKWCLTLSIPKRINRLRFPLGRSWFIFTGHSCYYCS